MLEAMTAEQFCGWADYYGRSPWGEDRADARNAVLAEHVNAPHYKNYRPRLSMNWPYAGSERYDPEVSQRWIKGFDAALVPKPGGGYTLSRPLEEIVCEAYGGVPEKPAKEPAVDDRTLA